MKLVDAEAMVGIDIAIINPDAWRSRWKDLREGHGGIKAKLVAVGKYRLTSQGWCNVTGYTPIDHGTNTGIAEYEVERANSAPVTTYREVPLNCLMSWATYSGIRDERRLRDAELEVMTQTRADLRKELALMRFEAINRMTRVQRSHAVINCTIREPWNRQNKAAEEHLAVDLRWDPMWDTKKMTDIVRRINVISEKLECRR